MTVDITYNADNLPLGVTEDSTIREVLKAAQNNGSGDNQPGSFGWFGGGDTFNGTSYTFSVPGSHFAFEADGDLHYYFPPLNGSEGDGPQKHTLWGTISSVSLGNSVDANDMGHVADPYFTATFTPAVTSDIREGRRGIVHDTVWGLMNGSVSGASDSSGTLSAGGLENLLEQQGVDLDQPLSGNGTDSIDPATYGQTTSWQQQLGGSVQGFFQQIASDIASLFPSLPASAQSMAGADQQLTDLSSAITVAA